MAALLARVPRPVPGDVTGALGDLGTTLPLAAGLVLVAGIDPGALLISFGIATLFAGALFQVPLPIQPQKAIAAAAIGQRWTAGWVRGAGLGSGIAWVALSMTPALDWFERAVPRFIVQGVQLALAATLAVAAVRLMTGDLRLGVAALVLFAIATRRPLTALALTLVLAVLVMPRGGIGLTWAPSSVALSVPGPVDVAAGMLRGGIAQLPLTLANALLATSALVSLYFPDRPRTPRRLAFGTGVMNLMSAIVGGVPLCHGAGGLAAQHLYGARTIWKNVFEGAAALSLGIFFTPVVRPALAVFPMPLLGGLLLLVAVELSRAARGLHGWRSWIALGMVAASLVSNIGVAFALGLGAAYAVRALVRRGVLPRLTSRTPMEYIGAIPGRLLRDRASS